MSDLVCDCGNPDWIAVRPGDEPETVDLMGTVLTTRRGTPRLVWCSECWPALKQEAPGD
jgi:hypothetical protein